MATPDPAVFGDEWDREAPVVVLEVSSYQAADLHHVPEVAVLTYLSEDHLSWHGGVEQYVADKLRLVRNEGGTAARVLVPSAGGNAAAALDRLGIAHSTVTPPAADPLVPVHRLANAALAAAALEAVGGRALSDDAIKAAATSSLPGRLDRCPAPPEILAIDDTLASNPTAAAAGLAWLREVGRPTVVLLGGTDRGVDPAPLAAEIAAWPAGQIVGVGLVDSGGELARQVGVTLLAESCSVTEAVATALAWLAERGGGSMAFSPAAPTPSRLGNWETRSAEFRAALA